eukprot:TRINITY_DN23317_c0_g1_i1.p2 TRINITY_DN23317_c0_g1~~TRINITY_DN23317_c0_g1_i1.p2  ORF type:complete len:103 (+),score=19.62 TRINITY_DN23317_c0_g1_i1:65-373(+)
MCIRDSFITNQVKVLKIARRKMKNLTDTTDQTWTTSKEFAKLYRELSKKCSGYLDGSFVKLISRTVQVKLIREKKKISIGERVKQKVSRYSKLFSNVFQRRS